MDERAMVYESPSNEGPSCALNEPKVTRRVVGAIILVLFMSHKVSIPYRTI